VLIITVTGTEYKVALAAMEVLYVVFPVHCGDVGSSESLAAIVAQQV